MNTQSISQYSIVDLFSGAGGLSYGFLQTGRFVVKAAFEMDQSARETYKRNHGSQVAMYNDVEDALSVETRKKLGPIDVVVGGPPCQGFSNANRQKNHVISKNNSLVKKFVQAVLHLNPSAFVMENVSMLQSDVHRFYVDKSDQTTIEKYDITTASAEIVLLDEPFLFDGSLTIVKNSETISNFLWDEKDYLVLNIIYKLRNNQNKLAKALNKHKKNLLDLAHILVTQHLENDSITHHNNNAGNAIERYFTKIHTNKESTALCSAIEPSIMVQRMLFKSQEINDNDIVVTEYSQTRGLTAKVRSMAVIDYIESILSANNHGYRITKGVLAAATFGAPQKRMRFLVMGVKKDKAKSIVLPRGTFNANNFRTVEHAIKDIESIDPAFDVSEGNKGVKLIKKPTNISVLGKHLRNSPVLFNHVSTATTPEALSRFRAIKQGNNFHSLPLELKTTYSDAGRTQNTIYLRLRYDEPSGTVVNVRKSMWIHPVLHRALSIREAARLQTFPDSFVFCGTKDSQYQQVGNAVPPMLATAIAIHLCEYLDEQTETVSGSNKEDFGKK